MSMFDTTTDLVVADKQPTTTAVAISASEHTSTSMANFSANMADMGFDGLDLTGMSFDRIKLHEGVFKCGSDEAELGTSFDCIMHSTRRLFVVRQHTGQDAKTFYSYDSQGRTNADGSSAEDTLKEWEEDGYTPDIKEYLEAMVTLVNRDDEWDDTMVMLSIPPASRAKLSGVFAQAMQRLGATPDQVIIKCSVGKQVGEGTKKFRPWAFKLVGRTN